MRQMITTERTQHIIHVRCPLAEYGIVLNKGATHYGESYHGFLRMQKMDLPISCNFVSVVCPTHVSWIMNHIL